MAVALVCASTVQANSNDIFRVSGYGTAGVTHSTEDMADYAPEIQSSKGVGASNTTTARLDSRLALQIDAQFTDDFSAVVQAVSEYVITESFKPKIALAHLKYRIKPDLSLRIGRITTPLYMLSEYQRVNYATPWVRQPNEVYNFLLPLDGVEALYTINAGKAVVGLQGFHGHVRSHRIDINNMAGAAITVDHGPSSARMSYVRGNIRFETDTINRVFDTYGQSASPELAPLVEALDPRHMDGIFKSIGYTCDPGNWFIRTEIIDADFTPAISSRTSAG